MNFDSSCNGKGRKRMRLNIVCGPLHFPVYADVVSPGDNQLADGECVGEHVKTFGALKEFIAETAKVDLKAIKIIHRGRTLAGEDNDSLEKFNFKKNDKLLVMGRPPASQENEGWKKLLECERKNIVVIGRKYDKNEEDLAALEQNFLEGPLRMEAIKKMERRLNQFTEDCLKELENIDGLEIIPEGTHEEQAQRNREKRKELINGIQDLLNRNDKFINRLKDYFYKVEHPEEGL